MFGVLVVVAVAVGLLAGTAAWCFDEPAAAIADTTPRHLPWQTAARSAGVVALLLVWVVTIAQTRSGYFGHALDVAWQGIAATLAVTAYGWAALGGLSSARLPRR